MPLLSPATIERVRHEANAHIADVVGRHVKLTVKGHQPTGKCPFHDEKSASFSVRPSHGTFKCFGCSAAGDAIKFIQLLKGVTFPDAVKELAEQLNLPVEYEEESPEQAKVREEKQAKRKAMQDMLDWALAHYQGNPLPERWLASRGWSDATAGALGMGYANANGNTLLEAAKKADIAIESLVGAELVVNHGGHYQDRFVDRVMIPIRDVRGNVVAFTGRLVSKPGPEVTGRAAAKYDNSGSKVWVKGDHLFHLDRALRAIAQANGLVYLVEGHPNVARFLEVGRANVVARGGTAFTDAQAALLKRYAKTVVIVPDVDKPGLKSMHDDVAPKLLALGLTVKVLLPDEGKDPDEHLLRKTHEEVNAWFRNTKDYVAGQLCGECQSAGEGDPAERAVQIERMRTTLELIVDDTVRQCYYNDVAKTWKDFGRAHKFKKRAGDLDLHKMDRLEAEQKADAFDYNFYEKSGRYWNNDGAALCNWTLDVLFFVRSETNPRYVVVLKRMMDGTTRTTSITTDDFTATGTFKKAIHRLGGFFWQGSEVDLINVKMKLLRRVPEATSPQTMGWNNAGQFFTWANGLLYDGTFVKPDRYGVVQLRRPLRTLDDFRRLRVESQVYFGAEQVLVDDPEVALEKMGEEAVAAAIERGEVAVNSFHFLPFASNLKVADDDDDGWENERRYKHLGKGDLTFSHWAGLVHRGFYQNGMVMVSFLVAALFRDIIYDANGRYFPLLNLFGQRGTGKSKAAEALAGMFGDYPADGVNVSSGTTPVAMSRYMSSVSNGLYWFNEYKNQSTEMKTIETLKGIADGSGRMTGRATGGNETRTIKPKSAAMLAGQDMPTKDSALLSRCVVLEFTNAHFAYTDVPAYRELDYWHTMKELTSVTCEILQHRALMLGYREAMIAVRDEVRDAIRRQLDASQLQNEERMVINLATLLTPMRLLKEVLPFPFTFDELLATLVERVNFQASVLKTGDDIGQYFEVLMSEVGRSFNVGEHYAIKREADGVEKLFLRFRAVHGVYQAGALRQGRQPLSEAVMKNYLRAHPYFLEERSKGVNIGPKYSETSAFVLNYEKMRADGIEFDGGDYNAKAAGVDDPSLELAKKIHLNGNAPELVYQFVEKQRAGTKPLAQLLAEFNANKEPAMTAADFIEQLKNYLVIVKRGRDLAFSDNFEKVRIEEYCPI